MFSQLHCVNTNFRTANSSFFSIMSRPGRSYQQFFATTKQLQSPHKFQSAYKSTKSYLQRSASHLGLVPERAIITFWCISAQIQLVLVKPLILTNFNRHTIFTAFGRLNISSAIPSSHQPGTWELGRQLHHFSGPSWTRTGLEPRPSAPSRTGTRPR